MKINQQKNKGMLFNSFTPMILCLKYQLMETQERGNRRKKIARCNMKWYANSGNFCKNGYSRLWML